MSFSQAASNDAGNVDLVDTQYLIFNLVTFAYVIIALAATNTLPAIPPFMFALTGVSAATYVVNKTAQTTPPTISAVVPSTQTPGGQVVVVGSNFKPAATPVPPIVTIGGIPAVIDPTFTDSQVTATLAANTPQGPTQPVVVTNAAGVSSQPSFVTV